MWSPREGHVTVGTCDVMTVCGADVHRFHKDLLPHWQSVYLCSITFEKYFCEREFLSK